MVNSIPSNALKNRLVMEASVRKPLELEDVSAEDFIPVPVPSPPPLAASLDDAFQWQRLSASLTDANASLIFTPSTSAWDVPQAPDRDAYLRSLIGDAIDSNLQDCYAEVLAFDRRELFHQQQAALLESFARSSENFYPSFASFDRTRVASSAGPADASVRVFVSSTFRDMGEEREVLIKGTMPRLRAKYEERGVGISEVDLRWGITSGQSQRGDTIRVCLSEVDRCRPFFVCMLGERYGWCAGEHGPDALLRATFDAAADTFPWIDRYRDRSVTELEVLAATRLHEHDAEATGGDTGRVQEMQRLFRDVQPLFLFRSPAYAKQKGPEYLAASPYHEQRLRGLKQLIRDSGFDVLEYESPDEVDELVFTHLDTALAHVFPERTPPTPLERARQAHDAFVASRSRIYVGGERALGELHAHAEGFLNTRPVCVVGESGSGKTALVANFVKQHRERHPHGLLVAHFIGVTSESSDVALVMRRVIDEVAAYAGLTTDGVSTDVDALKDDFVKWLAIGGRQPGGMVLVLDALNQLQTKHNAHDLKWLPARTPPGVRLVASSLPGATLDGVVRMQYHTLRVHPLSYAEREALVHVVMSGFSKTLSPSQLQVILDAPQCQSPLYLRTLLDELRVFGSFEHLDRHLLHCLSAASVPELYGLIFDRLESEVEAPRGVASKGALSSALTLILCANSGLSERDIVSILGLPQSSWSMISLTLAGALVLRSGLISFSHDYLRQAVEMKYVTESSRRTAHQQLASHFGVGFGGLAERDPTNQRVLDELPYHLEALEHWETLVEYIARAPVFLAMMAQHRKLELFRFFREAQRGGADVHGAIQRAAAAFGTLSDAHESIEQLCKFGKFLEDMGMYPAAETTYRVAERRSEGANVSEADRALVLERQGYLYRVMSRFSEATRAYENAVSIRAKEDGLEAASTASSLNGLAILHRKMGHYAKAEPLYRRALAIRIKVFGSSHAEVGQSLNSLGCLCQDQGQYEEAESYFVEAIRVREYCLGTTHPDVAMTLGNLAGLFSAKGRFDKAKESLDRALEIETAAYGDEHPDVASTLTALAGVLMELAQFDEAERVFERCVAMKEAMLGSTHPELAGALNDFAVFYARIDRYDRAGPLYERALDIRRRALGERHPDTAHSMSNLAAMWVDTDARRWADAERLFQEAYDAFVGSFGMSHSSVAQTLNHMANLKQRQRAPFEEIYNIYERSLKVLRQCFGRAHPEVALTLNDMALLCFQHGRFSEAEERYLEALDVNTQVFADSNHPDVVRSQRALDQFYSHVEPKGFKKKGS